jgi:hypothetical protein
LVIAKRSSNNHGYDRWASDQHLAGLHTDGDVFPVENSLSDTGEGDVQLAIGVVRDATAYREIEEEHRVLITTARASIEQSRT